MNMFFSIVPKLKPLPFVFSLQKNPMRALSRLFRPPVLPFISIHPPDFFVSPHRYLALKSLNKKMRVVVRVIDGLLQSHFPLDPGDVIIRPAEVRRTLSASSVLLPGASSLLPGLLFSLNEKDMVEVPTDSWKKEFMQSLSQEFYSFPGPPSLNGLTFGQAALMLYKAYRVILVAATAEVQLPGRGS